MSDTKEIIKVWTGSLLETIAPWVTRELDENRHSGRFIKLKRWIVAARTAKAKARNDAAALQKSLFQFWRTDTADSYFDQYLDRYQKWFLGPHHSIVDQLALLSRSGAYSRLVEVGCGAGQALEHCAAAMPEVQSFVGVDINPVIIARNKVTYAQNPRLQFLSADASVWLEENARSGTILLTYGGVMEYFSAETLAAMFRTLAQHKPAAVALVEPVDPGHDLENDAASHAFGMENSFSHNHEKLLQAAGYKVMFRKTLRLDGIFWVMLLATAAPPKTFSVV
jgi:SAM-dependent methyltransferase